MLHYLILGGCGQVGFHLSRRLLHNSHKVTVIDTVEEPHCARNRDDLIGRGLFNLLRIDCRDLSFAPKPWDVDRVFWMPCAESTHDIVGLQHAGLDSLLRWALQECSRGKFSPPRIVVVTPPYVHEAADAAVERYRAKRITVRSVRLWDVYGPRMSEHAVVQSIIDKMLGGEELVLMDGGQQQRALLHVEDVALALYNVINPAHMASVVNIAGDERWKMSDLAATIRRRLGIPASVRICSEQSGERLNHYPIAGTAAKVVASRSFESSFHEMARWSVDYEDILESEYGVD